MASTMKSNGSPSTIFSALSFASQNRRDLTILDRKSTRLNSSHTVISYAVDLCLHSFPTRRSSDLGGAFLSANISTMDSSFPTDVSIKAMSEGAKTEKKNGKYDEVKWLALDDLLGLEFRQSKQERPDDIRSEEHTSELQSHSDLVCRRPMPTLFPYTTLFRSRRCVSQRQHLHDGFEFSHRR